MEVSEICQTLRLEETLPGIPRQIRYSHTSCTCLGMSKSSNEGDYSWSLGMHLWVSESCCEDTAVPAVLNRWNIQRVLNKTYNSWKEITLQLQLGAAHTLPASEGGVFWRRGAEGETGEYSNNFISSSIAAAQAGTLPCRACGFLCEAIEFSCCGSKFSFRAVMCNLNLNFLIWVTVGY